VGDYSAQYYEAAWSCRPDYFAGAVNPVVLEDCFLFPENSLFDVISDYGYYTTYSNIFYWLYPKESVDPFASPGSSLLLGNYQLMNQLLTNYYYVVYFTSKVADPSTGQSRFQVNRFYSSDSAFNSD
jgi:hypothetical protein